MSTINCDYCGHPIDSDIDDGCFTGETVTCERCRDHFEQLCAWWACQNQDDEWIEQQNNWAEQNYQDEQHAE